MGVLSFENHLKPNFTSLNIDLSNNNTFDLDKVQSN
jgi:hypothetical protein